jgi:hypothetical protein
MKNLIIIMLVITCLFSSCLKSDQLYDYSGIDPLIINPRSNFPATQQLPPALTDSLFGVTKLNLLARYSYQLPATRDITVTFIRDDALIAQYNSRFLKNYKPLPANCYELPSTRLTIPAGSTQAELPIRIIPQNMNRIDDYIIAFSISDGDGIAVANNLKSIVYTLKGK